MVPTPRTGPGVPVGAGRAPSPSSRRRSLRVDDNVVDVGSELAGAHLGSGPVAGGAILPCLLDAERPPREAERLDRLRQVGIAGRIEARGVADRDHSRRYEESVRDGGPGVD